MRARGPSGGNSASIKALSTAILLQLIGIAQRVFAAPAIAYDVVGEDIPKLADAKVRGRVSSFQIVDAHKEHGALDNRSPTHTSPAKSPPRIDISP